MPRSPAQVFGPGGGVGRGEVGPATPLTGTLDIVKWSASLPMSFLGLSLRPVGPHGVVGQDP